MSRPPFAQQLDTAFEDVVGARGASRARYDALCSSLGKAAPALLTKPAPEAAPMLALPARVDDLAEMESVATSIAESSTDLVVVGMGGSSLSAETLGYLRPDAGLVMHYVDNIDPLSIAQLVTSLPWRTTSFLVISKSGGTIETQALMALFQREAKGRLGAGYAKHFTIITVPNDNPLHRLGCEHGMRILAHDSDLCGRFSILSAVGLIPAAAMGVDIRALRQGAQLTLATHMAEPMGEAVKAAAVQVALMEKGAHTHVMMHYADRLGGLAAWHRQCWAESLGKSGHGSTPIPSRGTTDQHSQLQLYLEGPADKYFTSMVVDSAGQGSTIGVESDDARLAYLAGHTLGDLAMAEQRATNATLIAKGCPLRSFTLEAVDETRVGAMLMQFMLEIMFTAHAYGINAYDQPAVEASKKLALGYLAGKE
jgi:glucose-6-phosphate isomerase